MNQVEVEEAIEERPHPDRWYSRIIENIEHLDLSATGFSRVLFRNCSFAKLRGTSFVKCTFRNCVLDSSDPRDILGVTLTLNCRIFDGIKMSPGATDAFLHLVAMGCADKTQQAKIHGVIDPHRLRLYKKIWHRLEIP